MELIKLKVRLQIRDENVRQEMTRIISSVDGFAVYGAADAGPADLLILQIGDRPEEEIKQARQAVSSGIAREVFLTSKIMQPEMLIEAMRAGVKEFFAQPLKADEVKRALRNLGERLATRTFQPTGGPKRQGKIIDVVGSKGGVGTTTVAVNLAVNLAEADRNTMVALIDMNLLFGEVPLFLGIESAFDWMGVAKNITRIDSTYLLSVMSRHASGVHILPSPAKVQDEFHVTPEVIEALLGQMKSMFDYIVIDSGQVLDDISRTILRLADSLIIVTLLSLPCLINVKRLLDHLQQYGYPRDEDIRILVNRNHKRSMISVADAEKSMKKPVFWQVPNDFQTSMSAINQGKTLAAIDPAADISASFQELAALVA
ncbi:MAG: AAA family ATPase, partial [Deltaproteobacteria bacterium]|nr:AAA family ATPase [Deltaproteobacteria bacterium]